MSSGVRGEAGSPVLPFSAGLLFFPGLFVLGRCVLRRLRCPEPHAEILAARLVSSVQAVMASTAGYIISSSCHHVIDDQHWLASWYPPFAVPYFIYDVYAMFLCHRHRARASRATRRRPRRPRCAAPPWPSCAGTRSWCCTTPPWCSSASPWPPCGARARVISSWGASCWPSSAPPSSAWARCSSCCSSSTLCCTV
ncbi:hypothetical protein Q9966_016299 [Columba livia]|nr:hypothetical protein Q9966_016299 [Columba livia]